MTLGGVASVSGGFLEFDFGGVAENVEGSEQGLGHEGHFAVFLASGLHGDLHVLAEGG